MEDYTDEEIGGLSEGNSDMEGEAEIEEFEHILDTVLTKQVARGRLNSRFDLDAARKFLRDTASDDHLQQYNGLEEEKEETFEDIEEAIPYMKRDTPELWDCESILTTYTNTEYRPQMICELSYKPICLNEITGIPKIRLPRQEKRQQQKEESVSDENPKPNLGAPRSKHEDMEHKKLRKRQVKEDRKVRNPNSPADRVFCSPTK